MPLVFGKTLNDPKRVVDFFSGKRHIPKQNHGNRRGFSRTKLQQQRETLEIVEDFASEYPCFFIFFLFSSFFFIFSFFHFFHFFMFFHFSSFFFCFLFFFIFSFFFFSFFHIFHFQFSYFSHFFIFFLFLSFSFIFLHFLSFSLSSLGAQTLIFLGPQFRYDFS